ncbi:DNA repair exonuclease [uncultured Methanobrevibacter sp.]|uniref:metallophosphoesterase family protein n=1 Tax=uncultured Methanobrevibacter sp. TaxID=253161 RepID=UPI0025F464CD|nr:DNA repair exonuclease [uncultured Methanobrevibacter sp.]MDO5810067.1 DNA repair exonuclease [Methanobrevibacter sp.]
MKFAHLADTHLGYRQYGLFEREKDFYEVFEKVIDKIIEENVDFVIHSGDLFETARPSPLALLTFQKGLLKLKGAGIPMYAIAGNHDVVMRKGSIPPQVIFKKSGLKVISNINPTYMHGDVFIAGLPFFPASHGKLLKSKLADLSDKASHHEKSILVLHQGIDKYFSFNYELEIGDIPDNFDYYAMGHIHKYVNDKFGKGRLVYPGSSEIWKTSEIPDYLENGKGFVVVEMDGPKTLVKRVKIDIPREFIKRTLDYNKLESGIAGIKETIKDFDKKPILNLTINNVDSDTSRVYELIKEELGELALMIRPTFNMYDEDESVMMPEVTSKLGPEELLKIQLKGYGSNVDVLSTELYDLLSKDKLEEAKEIIDQFYNDHYANINEDVEFKTEKVEEETPKEEKPEGQVTFKEVLE